MTDNGPSPTVPSRQRATLDEVIAVMRRKHGLDASGFDESFLATAVEKRRQVEAGESAEAYLERLGADRAEADALFRSLRVSYSEFFRDPLSFAWLEHSLLAGLLEEKKSTGQAEIRVWSAGCAAGQETWSVAILLDDLVAARSRQVAYRICATDWSEPDLALARGAVYSAAALGNVRLRHLDGCFSRQGEGFAVAPRIQARVEFSLYDLLDDSTSCPPASIYGGFDLVLCCNVLLYYRPAARRFILDKLRGCLATGGYLMTGETERAIVADAGGFRAVAPPAAIFRHANGRR